MFNSFVSCCLASVAFAATGVFDYKQNGADWGSLEGNELCDSGKEQSPINLNDWLAEESKDLAIILTPNTYIDETTATIEKSEHTIKVTTTKGEMDLVFDSGSKSAFSLAQFHVHAPSEHTYRGEHYDLEMHFVHAYTAGGLGAVIGVFFDREKGGDGDNLFID
jgi:carbonic anhydrase